MKHCLLLLFGLSIFGNILSADGPVVSVRTKYVKVAAVKTPAYKPAKPCLADTLLQACSIYVEELRTQIRTLQADNQQAQKLLAGKTEKIKQREAELRQLRAELAAIKKDIAITQGELNQLKQTLGWYKQILIDKKCRRALRLLGIQNKIKHCFLWKPKQHRAYLS